MMCESDELATFLRTVDGDERYRVVETLKESPFETTQKVMLDDGRGGCEGPFIRKYINRETGMGAVYIELCRAWKAGRCFRHVPAIYDCYEMGRDLVVIMQYIRGETLSDVVGRLGSSTALAIDVFPRLCDAVMELHNGFDVPIIHRDLKPSNVVLNQDQLMVIDFGIARKYSPESNVDTLNFGTRIYAPPEQFGFGQTDERSDVYALGMLLYYCLTERTTDFNNRTSRFADPCIPAPLRRVLFRATAFDPDARYKNVSELKRDFLRGVPRGGREVSRFGTDRPSPPVREQAPVERESLFEKITRRLPSLPDGRISHGVGRVWNACVIAVLCLFIGACWQAALVPNEHDLAYPFWFRLIVYGLCCSAIFVAMAFCLYDKRRLGKRFPLWRKVSFPRSFLIGAGVIGFFFGVIMVVGQFVVEGGLFVS